MARPKYDLVLDPIGAPVQSREGELKMAAGQSEGKAAVIDGQTDAAAITFLGTNAIDAAKGKLTSDLDKSIADSLSKLDTGATDPARSYLRSEEFANNTAKQLAMLNEQSGGLDDKPQLVKDFMRDIQRYDDALSQGTLDRASVLARISADVKKYTNLMPGWASDFRKLAAERTGISNIDVYGVHQALTQKTAREKQLEIAQAAQVQLDKDIASKYGVALDQVTPQMRAYHAQVQQLNVATQVATDKIKMSDLSQGEADKSWGQVAMLQTTAAVAGFGEDIAALGAANENPNDPTAGQQLGLRMAGKLAATAVTLEQNIRAMTRPVPGQTALSVKEADRLIGEVRTAFKNYEDMVKNVEGRNMFNNIVKSSQGRADMLINNFMTANPHVAVLNRLGVASELFKAHVALPPEEFRKRFGPALSDAMIKMMSAPAQSTQHAAGVAAVVNGEAPNLAETGKTNPALKTVLGAEYLTQMENIPKKTTVTPQEQDAWVKFTTQAGINFNPMAPQDINKINQILASNETQAFLRTLSTEQKAEALSPFVANIDRTIAVGVMPQLRATVASYNDPATNPAAEAGATISIKRNSLTGMFEVESKQPTRPSSVRMKGEITPAFSVEHNRPTSWMTESANAKADKARATVLVDGLNKMLATYSLTASQFKPEMTLDVVQDNVLKNFINYKKTPINETPVKPTPTSKVDDNGFPIVTKEQQEQRDLEAASIRKREGVTQADVDAVEAALKTRGLDGSTRRILKRELELNKKALNLSEADMVFPDTMMAGIPGVDGTMVPASGTPVIFTPNTLGTGRG